MITAIVGPTACGKSLVGEFLVKNFNAHVINFDSCQIFKGLEVLKATPNFLVNHHLYSIFDHNFKYSVLDWVHLAKTLISKLMQTDVPIVLIGGTAFYLKVLLEGIDSLPAISSKVHSYVDCMDIESIKSLLLKYDVDSYYSYKDLDRLKRSLKVFLETNMPIKNFFNKKSPFISNVTVYSLILNREKNLLNIQDRLNRDFDSMLCDVRKFYDLNNFVDNIKVIGLKEIRMYLNGEIHKNECLAKVYHKISQYSKRQSTYIRNCLKVNRCFNSVEDLLKMY